MNFKKQPTKHITKPSECLNTVPKEGKIILNRDIQK